MLHQGRGPVELDEFDAQRVRGRRLPRLALFDRVDALEAVVDVAHDGVESRIVPREAQTEIFVGSSRYGNEQ